MDEAKTHPAAPPNQSGADSAVARRQLEVGGFAGCMVLAAAHLRASGMEIIAMARGQRKLSSWESSFEGWARRDIRGAITILVS